MSNLEPRLDLDVRSLKIDDESVRLIVFSLASELQDFLFRNGVSEVPIVSQLEFVMSVLGSDSRRLLDITDVPTTNASDIASIRVRFSNEGYRFLANAAKDAAAVTFNIDAKGF